MNKKISHYFINHPWRCGILFLFFMIILAIALPVKIIVNFLLIIGSCLMVFLIGIIIIFSLEEKKEKQNFFSMGKEDYEKKWIQYVDLVNEMINKKRFDRNNLDTNWIQTFHQIIYAIGTNRYLLRRNFNDFDIAACLVYSLTLDNPTDENILFAFDCAKRIISEPKEYIRDLGYGYKLELKVKNTFPKVNICIPNLTITAEALTSIIRTYLRQKKGNEIVQLSDFLHILYLKCK